MKTFILIINSLNIMWTRLLIMLFKKLPVFLMSRQKEDIRLTFKKEYLFSLIKIVPKNKDDLKQLEKLDKFKLIKIR